MDTILKVWEIFWEMMSKKDQQRVWPRDRRTVVRFRWLTKSWKKLDSFLAITKPLRQHLHNTGGTMFFSQSAHNLWVLNVWCCCSCLFFYYSYFVVHSNIALIIPSFVYLKSKVTYFFTQVCLPIKIIFIALF